MNILMLTGGSSAGFQEVGYIYPKNLVEISGHPMIQHVVECLNPLETLGGRFLCVLNRDENRMHHTGKVMQLMHPNASIIEINQATSGAACSALLAIDHIFSEDELVIANGDQILLDVNLAEVIQGFRKRDLDAGVVVFEDIHPRWSFVKCNEHGLVIETAEKRPISKHATAGFYYFKQGKEFVQAAIEMIKKDAHVMNQFYICPSLNELILKQKKIGIHEIQRSQYHSLSTPSDVHSYAALLDRKTQDTH